MSFAPALSHGPLTEVFPGVFVVRGSMRMGPGVVIPRNMTVVKNGDGLVLINSVRLTDAGERSLDALGKVEHLVRLGSFHGIDDPYYVDRYKPEYWEPTGMAPKNGLKADQELKAGQSPIADAQVMIFAAGKSVEAALILARAGGILVTCDSFQNWATTTGASPMGKIIAHVMGFGPSIIGPMWLKATGHGVRADFEKLLTLEWKHALCGHGDPLLDRAQDGMRSAMSKAFG